MLPLWLHWLSLAALLLGLGSAVIVAADEVRRPQHMAVMNLVWPLVSLFAGPLALWGYFRFGVMKSHAAMQAARAAGRTPPKTPRPVMTAIAASHCGSGCTLGDLLAETLAYFVPGVLAWFGLGTLFGDKIFAAWVLDFVLAYLIGIVFQYFTIAPMRGLGVWAGIVAALKADTLSLAAWQIGMYAVMALGQFVLARPALGRPLDAAMPEFWFLMQIAMLAGFAASYPVNGWLLRAGLKEEM